MEPTPTATPTPVLAKKVTLNKNTATVTVGLTLQLKATVSPTGALDGAVTWKSGNTAIATVSKKGLVTAKKTGAVTIRAMTAGGLKAYCKVTVKGVQVYQCVKGGICRYTTRLSTAKQLRDKGYSASKAFLAAGKSKTPVYSVYNSSKKRYQYTTDRSVALAKKKAGFKVSAAFYASDTAGTPVYELEKSGVYRYTTSKTTAKSLKKAAYKYNGIVWQACAS